MNNVHCNNCEDDVAAFLATVNADLTDNEKPVEESNGLLAVVFIAVIIGSVFGFLFSS